MTDIYLAAIVRSVNNGGITGARITVALAGHLISGTLISYRAWVQGLYGHFADMAINEYVEAGMKQAGAEFADNEGEDGFFHLVNIRAQCGASHVNVGGAASWRGRVDDVLLWSFGGIDETPLAEGF